MENISPEPTIYQAALVLVGYNRQANDELQNLAEKCAAQLNIHVQPAFLQSGSPSLGEAIRRCAEEYGARTVIVLPLLAGATLSQQRNIGYIISAARERFSGVHIFNSPPLGVETGVVKALKKLAHAPVPNKESTLILLGTGSDDPATNAAFYQLTRLIWEDSAYGAFESAFNNNVYLQFDTAVERCVRNGAKRIVVLPHCFYENNPYERAHAAVERVRTAHPTVEFVLTERLDANEQMVSAISQRYAELLNPLCNFCPFMGTVGSTHTHGSMQSILPPRYQGNVTVSAAPMSAAALTYDADGAVAWDQMWTGFCELALAGGPPHRGTLLEPPTPEAIRANPDGYQRTLDELTRGIRLVTSLDVLPSQSPGWIGVRCTDEEMALWLLRAIVVENISVRREGEVLYLPAGPDFRLAYEIKNVITALAKTHHYWLEHISR